MERFKDFTSVVTGTPESQLERRHYIASTTIIILICGFLGRLAWEIVSPTDTDENQVPDAIEGMFPGTSS